MMKIKILSAVLLIGSLLVAQAGPVDDVNWRRAKTGQ